MPIQGHEIISDMGHDAKSILKHYALMLNITEAEYIELAIIGYRPPLTAYFKRYLKEHHPDPSINLYTLEKMIGKALPGITDAEKQTIIDDIMIGTSIRRSYR